MSSHTMAIGSGVPLHAKIADDVRREIARGSLKVGDALPTAKDLATESGTHENTVLRAYRSLQAEGLIDLRRSRGATVRARPDYDRLDGLIDELLGEAEAQQMSVGALLAHIVAQIDS